MIADIIAKYFIDKGMQEKRPISNKKLQKLLYYAQAWSLVLRKRPLFDEKIRAWVHGPAIREVYSTYKRFGFDPIIIKLEKGSLSKLPGSAEAILDDVWQVYGKYDAGYLEHLSHTEQPWQEARGSLEAGVGSDVEITHDSMRKYFSEKIGGSDSRA